MSNSKAPEDQERPEQTDPPAGMPQTARTTQTRPTPPKFVRVAKKKSAKKATKKAGKKR